MAMTTKMMAAPRDYWTAAEMAEKLGVSYVRVWQMAIKERKLPYVRFGRSLRFPKAAYHAWQSAQVREALAVVGVEVPPDAA